MNRKAVDALRILFYSPRPTERHMSSEISLIWEMQVGTPNTTLFEVKSHDKRKAVCVNWNAPGHVEPD